MFIIAKGAHIKQCMLITITVIFTARLSENLDKIHVVIKFGITSNALNIYISYAKNI